MQSPSDRTSRRTSAWRQKKGEEFIEEYMKYRFLLIGIGPTDFQPSRVLENFLKNHEPSGYDSLNQCINQEAPHLQQAAEVSTVAPSAHEFIAADPVAAAVILDQPTSLINDYIKESACPTCDEFQCEDCVEALISTDVPPVEDVSIHEAVMLTVPTVTTLVVETAERVFSETLSVQPFSCIEDTLPRRLVLHYGRKASLEVEYQREVFKKLDPEPLIELSRYSVDCARMVVKYLNCREQFFLRVKSSMNMDFVRTVLFGRNACRLPEHLAMTVDVVRTGCLFQPRDVLPMLCICQTLVAQFPQLLSTAPFRAALNGLSLGVTIPTMRVAVNQASLRLSV